MRSRALLAAAFWAWGAAALLGVQAIRDSRSSLKSGADVVLVTALVRDEHGGLVTGLTRDAFEIAEDGVPQTIEEFTSERVPVGLGVLLDVSDSMFGQRIDDARLAVDRFLFTLLDPTDEFFLVAFNHAPRTLTPWTTTPAVVRDALDAITPSGGTAIYDAVISALPQIRRRSRQRAALVVISDGADTASDATIREVRAALVRSDAFVYAIAIDSPRNYAINTRVNPEALTDITAPSGGRTEVVTDAEGLARATALIAEELNSQYVLGYSSPKSTDGKFHSIRVSMKDRSLKARARTGYVGGPSVRGR
jgi:Ca-activated chloride channel family protein